MICLVTQENRSHSMNIIHAVNCICIFILEVYIEISTPKTDAHITTVSACEVLNCLSYKDLPLIYY